MRLVLAFIVLFSIQSFAQRNPLMRECRLAGGQFFVADGDGDSFGFCKFGIAAIDSLSIVKLRSGNSTIAIQNYLTSTDAYCTKGWVAQLESGKTFEVCRYSDDSMIELNTLKRGFGSAENKLLDEAMTR